MLRAVAWLLVLVAALAGLWLVAWLLLGDHLADVVALAGLSLVCVITFVCGRW